MTGLLSGATAVPESIAGLAQGVIKTMLLQSIKLAGIAALVAAGVLGTFVTAKQGNLVAASESQEKPAPKSDQPAPLSPEEQARLEIEEINRLYKAEQEKKHQRIEKQLDLIIAAEFPDGVSLQQLLKYIKQQTTSALPPGLPIYVSPLGLREAKCSSISSFRQNSRRSRSVTYSTRPWRRSGCRSRFVMAF